MTSGTDFFITVTIIGLLTLLIRAVFLFKLPDQARHPLVERGMKAVPAAMLVALVLPFTFFDDQRISLFRPEVYAILLALPLMRVTKKYSYGLVFAVGIYFILTLVI